MEKKFAKRGSLTDIIQNSPIDLYEGRYAVIKCDEMPACGSLFMAVDDGEEITVIVEENHLGNVAYEKIEKWFKLISIHVSTPFLGVGLLAEVSTKIAEGGMDLLIVSAFSKDFILLKEDDAEQGMQLLKETGFPVL